MWYCLVWKRFILFLCLIISWAFLPWTGFRTNEPISQINNTKSFFGYFAGLLASREREISELKAKVTEVLAVMPSMNETSQLGHNLGISDLGSGLSMSGFSSYLSTYQLSMTDLGLSGNLNLNDLNQDHGSSSLAPSSPLTAMRPYASKLFNHTNGVGSLSGLGVNDDKGPKPGSNLDPNATAYTPKTIGNVELWILPQKRLSFLFSQLSFLFLVFFFLSSKIKQIILSMAAYLPLAIGLRYLSSESFLFCLLPSVKFEYWPNGCTN